MNPDTWILIPLLPKMNLGKFPFPGPVFLSLKLRSWIRWSVCFFVILIKSGTAPDAKECNWYIWNTKNQWLNILENFSFLSLMINNMFIALYCSLRHTHYFGHWGKIYISTELFSMLGS